MKNILKSLVIATLFSAVLPAHAAIQNYTFNGAIDSGFYNGELFSGGFSFDDASLIFTGTELVDLTSASMSFLSTTFTETNFVIGTTPSVVFVNGSFLGLEWSFDSVAPDVGFSFIPGTVDQADAFVSYTTTLGFAGASTVNYSSIAAVPEAETYAMFLAGLGLMGIVTRRKRV